MYTQIKYACYVVMLSNCLLFHPGGGFYVTDPLHFVHEDVLFSQLCVDSTLTISRHNVVARWRDDCDLNKLISLQDPRWSRLNVLGIVIFSLC